MPVQALLFDLGGVVIDFDFRRAFAAWAPHSPLSADAMRQLFRFDEPYERHEIGELASDAYFRHLADTLALDCPQAQVEAGWNSVFIAPIAETLDLIDRVRGQLPCHALSNTNALHLRELRRAFPELLARFGTVFASNEIRLRKPRPEAFAHVLQAIGAPAQDVLFFDDLPENVEGARRCGLQAVLVRSPADVRQALQDRGLLA
jgi:FMN phosphatase YigB (HAD superfamily)